MRKLAIKIKVKNAVDVLAPMKAGGKVFGEEYSQFDRVFVPRGHEEVYDDFIKVPQLLIRTNEIKQQISHVMILKRSISSDLTYFFQTQVMDYNQTAHIVNNMGYELYAEVPKKRRKIVVGSIIIYLDKIEGYDGWYLKLEKNLQDHESESTDEMWAILSSLDLQHAIRAPKYSEIVKKGRNGR